MMDAILFVQLGSPADETPASVEKYLLEFLGDPHTLGNPPFFWNWLLRHIIAPKRAPKSALKYAEMVKCAGLGKMPLVYYTEKFSAEVGKILAEKYPQIMVRHAFEFGTTPTISDALKEFAIAKKTQIYVVPLFPQRSLVTTVAVRDLVSQAAKNFPQLSLQFIEGFSQNLIWQNAILQSVFANWNQKAAIVFSFHGTPSAGAKNGDPYSRDCADAFEYFQKKIIEKFPHAEIFCSYQSRFGHGKWLGPFTSSVLQELAQKRKSVLLVCPSFTADNLETLYEVDVELRNEFIRAGGSEFFRVPCLNDNADWASHFANEIIRIGEENLP